MQHWKSALSWLDKLSGHAEFDNPQRWLLQAQCHARLQELDKAAELYARVLEHEPHRMQVRITLARLYEAMGTHARALEVLQSSGAGGKSDASLSAAGVSQPTALLPGATAASEAPRSSEPQSLISIANARRPMDDEASRKRKREFSASGSPALRSQHLRVNKAAIETVSQRMMAQYQRCMLLSSRSSDLNVRV